MEIYRYTEYTKCPFCGGEYAAVGETPELENSKSPGVLHTTPHCSEFEALEPDIFMTVVREKRFGKGGN